MRSPSRTALLALTFLTGASIGARAEEMPVIEVTLNDGVITPQHIEVAAGTPFKLSIRNVGTTAAEFESQRLYKEKVLAPGAASFLVFRKLSAGSYPFYDEFHMNLDSANGTITAK
ncbi:cupredoxin domain-containing protein [Pseudorhodobacter sp.]|uniref:cupredoxin domain-containing protein n=1 Tax=Pseudorhodobacter sp. TaxID=1934400 RepID=UPI0026472AD3|nr:cupredoxin domain-containing protein [Pseudorhodobacter sp.]MDN5787109.1 cupredoxin domain-containing protein [Pseudorhodobacter sp.]